MASEFDNLDELASEAIEPVAQPQAQPQSDSAASTRRSKSGFLGSMLKDWNIYNAMLVAGALCISLACVLMMFELSTFSDGFFNQWRTNEAFVEPIRP